MLISILVPMRRRHSTMSAEMFFFKFACFKKRGPFGIYCILKRTPDTSISTCACKHFCFYCSSRQSTEKTFWRSHESNILLSKVHSKSIWGHRTAWNRVFWEKKVICALSEQHASISRKRSIIIYKTHTEIYDTSIPYAIILDWKCMEAVLQDCRNRPKPKQGRLCLKFYGNSFLRALVLHLNCYSNSKEVRVHMHHYQSLFPQMDPWQSCQYTTLRVAKMTRNATFKPSC